MNKLTTVLLALCLAVSGGAAFAKDSMPMDQGTMSKDAMSKDTMKKDDMSMAKDKTNKMKPVHKKADRSDAMKKDTMKMEEPMSKGKGM